MNCERAGYFPTGVPGTGRHDQVIHRAQPRIRDPEGGDGAGAGGAVGLGAAALAKWAWSPVRVGVSSNGICPSASHEGGAEVLVEKVTSASSTGKKVNMPSLLVDVQLSRPFGTPI